MDIVLGIIFLVIIVFIASIVVRRERNERKKLSRSNRLLDEKVSRLMVLYQVGKEVSSSLSLENLLKRVMDVALKVMEAETSSLWLIDSESKELVCRAAQGLEKERIGKVRLSLGEGITGWVANEGQPQRVADLERDPRYKNPLGRKESSLKNQLSVPLKVKGKIIGVLNVFNKVGGEEFNEDDTGLLSLLASQVAISLENSRLYEAAERKIEEVSALLEIGKEMHLVFDLEELLNLIMDTSIKTLEADTGSLMLLDEEKEELTIEVARGLSEELIKGVRIKMGESVGGWVAKEGKPVLIPSISYALRFKGIRLRDDIRSALAVPLKVKDKVIGVLNLNNKRKGKKFTEEDLRLLSAFASQAALAIERSRLYEDLLSANLKTMQALAFALDARDDYTFGHSKRVTDYVLVVGEALGLQGRELKSLEYAASLHDIGKIGITDRVLRKPGSLTPEEFELIKDHTMIGANIVRPVEFLKEAVPLIYHHHERYDGKGYPAGLKGEEIPIGARILGVVDAFEAMTSDRPYRKALAPDVAIEELKRWAGIQFDPQVVEVFIEIYEKAEVIGNQ